MDSVCDWAIKWVYGEQYKKWRKDGTIYRYILWRRVMKEIGVCVVDREKREHAIELIMTYVRGPICFIDCILLLCTPPT
jgi:hypothetical protein